MIGPVVLPIVLGAAGWFSGGWAGVVVGLALGILVNAAVVAGAAVWARQIGALLDPVDAFAVAPRPPGFRRLCEWVYRRTLPPPDT